MSCGDGRKQREAIHLAFGKRGEDQSGDSQTRVVSLLKLVQTRKEEG